MKTIDIYREKVTKGGSYYCRPNYYPPVPGVRFGKSCSNFALSFRIIIRCWNLK